MPEASMLSAEEIQLLTEIGFLGAGYGLTVPAERLFQGLQVLRPGRGFPAIGLAMCLLSKGDGEGAAKLLEQALPTAGEDGEMVKAFQGYALLTAKHTHQARTLLALAAAGADPQAAKLAWALLDNG